MKLVHSAAREDYKLVAALSSAPKTPEGTLRFDAELRRKYQHLKYRRGWSDRQSGHRRAVRL